MAESKKVKRFLVTVPEKANAIKAPWTIFEKNITDIPLKSIKTSLVLKDNGEIKTATVVYVAPITEKTFSTLKNPKELVKGKLSNGTEYSIWKERS